MFIKIGGSVSDKYGLDYVLKYEDGVLTKTSFRDGKYPYVHSTKTKNLHGSLKSMMKFSCEYRYKTSFHIEWDSSLTGKQRKFISNLFKNYF